MIDRRAQECQESRKSEKDNLPRLKPCYSCRRWDGGGGGPNAVKKNQ